MSRNDSPHTPKFRFHKATGQAYVQLNSKRFYLGAFDQPESRQRYHRMIAEWESNGRQLRSATQGITVVELIAHFWRHAKLYYRKPDGSATSELDNFRQALRPLKELYASENVSGFGPLCLRAVQHQMVKHGWARTNVNKQIGRIKSVFRWGTEQELVPPGIYHGLLAVSGLRRGRSNAHETEPIKPVADQLIDAIQPFVSNQVWAMIQVQRFTGARAGSVVIMRACDLDTTGKVWVYTPSTHKTAHHGHRCQVLLGPKAQVVIRPFLKPDLSAFLFSPIDAEAQRRAELHASRQTLHSCGNRPGTNRRSRPARCAGLRYDVASYRRAIDRAIEQAFPLPEHLVRLRVAGLRGHTRWETTTDWMARLGDKRWSDVVAWRRAHHWHPHQLKHTAGTSIRRDFGIEVTQTILGHRLGSAITEVYAEANVRRAMEVIEKIG